MPAMRYYPLCTRHFTSSHPGTAKAIKFVAYTLHKISG